MYPLPGFSGFSTSACFLTNCFKSFTECGVLHSTSDPVE